MPGELSALAEGSQVGVGENRRVCRVEFRRGRALGGSTKPLVVLSRHPNQHG